MARRKSKKDRFFWLQGLMVGTISLVALVSTGVASGTGSAFDPSPEVNLRNGWRIFMYGVTAQGRIIQNSHGMEGVGCAMCHGEDGRGGRMHGMFAPNITFAFLSDPRGYRAPHGRQRPAYNEESVKAAIVAGIDAGGNPLDPEMPRWTGLTAKDLEDLIGYLKRLGPPRGDQGGRSEGI